MNINLSTIVYGEKHINMFQKSCLKSLSSKQNKAALYDSNAKWNIFSDKKDFHHLEKIIDAYLPELPINLVPMIELQAYLDPIQSALVMNIEECLKDNKRLLFCPPDTIFGEGTIPNMLKAGRDKGSCVAVPHPRVLPEFLKDYSLFHTGVSNPELVTMAWKHLHKAWTDAEVGHQFRNSYSSGVSWQRLSEGLYLVEHLLPTIYLSDFLESDLMFFKSAINSGVWDHVWPSQIVKQFRQRYVTSSDACFIVEITDAMKNVPPIGPGWEGDPDTFWTMVTRQPDHEHNYFNKQVLSVFRGE